MTHIWIALILHIIIILLWNQIHRTTLTLCRSKTCKYLASSIPLSTISFLKDKSYFIFIYRFSLIIKFEFIFGSSHTKYLKSIYLGHKLCWTFWKQFWELLQKYVRKTGTEISSINIKLFLTRNVYVLTSWTVDLDSWCWKLFWDTYRKHIMSFTENSWTVTKGTQHVFFLHHGEASWCKNKSCVNQTIEIHCWLIYLKEVLVI